jgi:hypothetical protein
MMALIIIYWIGIFQDETSSQQLWEREAGFEK